MGSVILDTSKNCCNRDGNTIFKYKNYVPIIIATDLEVIFLSKEGGCPNTFVYIVYVQVIGVWWCFGSRSAFTVTPEVLNWD